MNKSLLVTCSPVLTLLLVAAGASAQAARPTAPAVPPKTGYVVHFDFIQNASEGRQLVRAAVRAGAKVVNIVPPAQVWKNRQALKMLDAILDEVSRQGLSFLFSRIDASYPPDRHGRRFNYLYGRILTEPAVLPNGARVKGNFLLTVGRKEYDRWMEEEISFYAKRYGGMPNLLGINLGPFSEPFSSERCGFLEYMRGSERYEIIQYSPQAARWWRGWLKARFSDIHAVNREYHSSFASLKRIPLPRNESDSRFGRPEVAYFDFVRALNDWFVERYERCRRLWHDASQRPDVPLILQFNGAELEKLVKGRPSYAAFDLPGWVAGADAVGLSLYTNSGYPDFGHASIKATVSLAALAKDLGKDVFVLEGGCEAPNVVLNRGELEFFGTVALALRPRTYIYEFLKDKFDEVYPSNPGKLVTAKGAIRWPAFAALRDLFAEIGSARSEVETPAVYVPCDRAAARGNRPAGELNAALYDLASDIPIRWLPDGLHIPIPAGALVVRLDGSVAPADPELSRLLRSVPAIDSPRRARWRAEVIRLLRKHHVPIG